MAIPHCSKESRLIVKLRRHSLAAYLIALVAHHSDVSLLAPRVRPRVLDEPKVLSAVGTIAHHRDAVVELIFGVTTVSVVVDATAKGKRNSFSYLRSRLLAHSQIKLKPNRTGIDSDGDRADSGGSILKGCFIS